MYRPAQTLTVGNARTVLAAGLAAIADGQTHFDLQDLTMVDSAAVATLVAWQRAAQKAGKTLAFSNVPANLISLVDLYGVAELLHASATTEPRGDLPHH
jgi:phospholipid transport system transporter-binding protein